MMADYKRIVASEYSKWNGLATSLLSVSGNSSGKIDLPDVRPLHKSEDDEFEVLMNNVRPLIYAGVLPLAAFGIIGNVVALWGWSAKKIFNATIFLFKCLAMWDIAFLVMVCIWLVTDFNHGNGNVRLALRFLVYSLMGLSVHTTLLVTIVRWLAIFRPLRARILLTRRRTLIACFVVMFWCLSLETVRFSLEVTGDYYTEMISYCIIRSVTSVLPWFFMCGLNVSLAKKVRSASFSDNDSVHRSKLSASKSITRAVIVMTLTSMLAYPIFVSAEIQEIISCFHTYAVYECKLKTGLAIHGTGTALRMINSSVNIIFYNCFASKFRELLRKRRRHCLYFWKKRFASSDSNTMNSSFSSNGLRPSVGTVTEMLEQRESIV